ncbi:sensor domain-containing diguanylate cyclase [Sporomusa sp. KB1]|uniref:sensor domain-containing diguanylate cyclase n=1 Tax=Sporomusa sp. KB1 TaxID=943346 RepID=UPI002103496B|nr:sensor domain-containing diguanylate cyclase [Sporomusa sp. KB1]
MVVVNSLIQFMVFDKIFLSDTDALLLETNEQAANNVSIQLLENFKKIEMSLKVIAVNEKIRENQDTFDKINMILPEVDVLTILNQQGDILLVSGNQFELVVSNLSQREYFRQAIQGKTYISDVFTSARGFKVVTIAVPIIKDNKIDGVLVGAVKLHGNSLASMFDNKLFGRNGYISILDRQGDIVYHPNKERIGQKAIIFDQLHGQTGSKIMTDFSEKEHFVGYSRVSELDWIVTINTPTADVIKNRNIMIFEILLLSIISILVIILVGTYTVRRYTKPLAQLILAFNTLKDGNYKKIDSGNYEKEFQEIVHVYNNMIEKLEEVHNDLEECAEIDSLTSAYNRRAFDNYMRILKQEISNGTLDKLGVFLLDIDNFKSLNDTSGHLTGDHILKKITEIMRSVAGAQSVFRFGGDEFAVVLRDISDETLLSIAEAIRLESEKSLDDCTVSIGVANYPQDTNSIDKLIEFADKALYISKNSKNKVTSYTKL